MTARELVAVSRAAQGLPPNVTDPGALSRLAAILAASGHARNEKPAPVGDVTGSGMEVRRAAGEPSGA